MSPDDWKAYNLAKWAQVEGTLPGLSFSQSGPDETTFILGFSGPGVGEQRIVVGRVAFTRARAYMGGKGRAAETGFEDKEVIDGGENVSFDEVKRIVECWRGGKRYEPK